MRSEYTHIAIAGNIGVGKTSLTELVAKEFGYQPYFEPLESNPYMDLFYSDMKRWSFHVQMHFLVSRYRQLLEIEQRNTGVVQDRCIDEDAYIFASTLHDQGLLSEEEYSTYFMAFKTIINQVYYPDLVVFLKNEPKSLLRNIKKRNRRYELSIGTDYLELLDAKYNRWFEAYDKPKLDIDLTEVDFINSSQDQIHVLQILSEAFGD